MHKSQNGNVKLFGIFFLLFTALSFSAFCESADEKLAIADSLFSGRKYTQAFELYREILEQDKKSSPAMLLKMAFVKEGLGDFTDALYYLNLYYLKTYNKRALKKMENLAEKYKVTGYDYDDVQFFLNLFYRYQVQIDLFVMAMVLLFFAILFYKSRVGKKVPRTAAFYYIAFLAILLLLNNFGREYKKAIITFPETHLMAGPSAGADVLGVVSAGHRVNIKGKKDVWVKISWNDRTVWVREDNLKPVEL